MTDIEISLYYETDTSKCVDYFDLGNQRVDNLDDIELDDEKFDAFMDALAEVSPAPIYFDTIPRDRNGCYGYEVNEIFISWKISPAMQIRTIIHEMAHAILEPWPDGIKPVDEVPRPIRETEAEAVAYLVCLHYGLDTSAYSIGYIHGWIRHLTDAEAEQAVERIRKTVDDLIAEIDAELEKQT